MLQCIVMDSIEVTYLVFGRNCLKNPAGRRMNFSSFFFKYFFLVWAFSGEPCPTVTYLHPSLNICSIGTYVI